MSYAQRLSLENLHRWEAAGFGMFIHFGMSTFLGEECPDGTAPLSLYAPGQVDADGWIRVARDAGFRYIVLTAKHVAGHCLWPSSQTDYRICGSNIDVVGACANACAKHGLGLGVYYCSWDNHHRFGTVTAGEAGIFESRVTDRYLSFQLAQLEELLTQYGELFEMWIDIPQVLGPEGRQRCYELCASLQPEMPVIMNQGGRGNSLLDVEYAWPTDISTRERQFPECQRWGQGMEGTTVGHHKEYAIGDSLYYVPTEICDCIGYYWFYDERDRIRTAREIAAMRHLARERGCNLLLNVPPGPAGRLTTEQERVLVESALE